MSMPKITAKFNSLCMSCILGYVSCTIGNFCVKMGNMKVIHFKEALMQALTITPENFETEVMQSEKPVLLDFWAPWCGPCRIIGPIIDELASELTDVRVGKVNVDEAPELAASFGAMSIPLLVVVKNGQPVTQTLGAQPKEAILEMLQPYRV